LPLGAARRVGILGPDGRELLAGRVIVPEIRSGQPIWLVGRTITPTEREPKYLGLAGRKPLLGWEAAASARQVWLTEGVFDWLTLSCWGFPALALVGTHARPATLRALERFDRVWLVLDNDQAGREATAHLRRVLGSRATAMTLPGVKDVAELAPQPDGRACFQRTIEEANRTSSAYSV
jgi:DNA primase